MMKENLMAKKPLIDVEALSKCVIPLEDGNYGSESAVLAKQGVMQMIMQNNITEEPQKLDLSKTGKAVIRMLAQDYLRTELSDIYTEAELDIIYKDAVDVSLEACGEYTVGTDTNEVTFFVFEKGTWMPLMDKITININQ